MGDEMGLGKTIQLICFLGGLHFSGKHKTALIVAPVTTLQHWLRELHTWYPRFRVIKLHNSSMRLGAAPSPSPERMSPERSYLPAIAVKFRAPAL